jgi:hypothetical protein
MRVGNERQRSISLSATSITFLSGNTSLTLYLLNYRFLNLIMIHGEKQIDASSSTNENVIGSDNQLGGGTSQTVITNVDSTDQQEKKRIFERIEREMEVFRKGEYSRFQASSVILGELGKWGGVTDKEKGKAFDSYLAEINSHFNIQDEVRSATRETSQPLGAPVPFERPAKRIRNEVGELLDEISKGEPEGEESEPRVIRRRAREEEMPWYDATTSSSRRISCVETCRTLLQFSEDLSGTKSLLRVANNLPEGIPSSQWDRILRGESVDLNQILSTMHFVQLDEERKGRMGTAEVVFAVAESKRHVRTGAEWSSAFRRMSKAVVFLFPHRREELLEYAEYIESLFSAKHASAHSKVILYDQSVRNQVGGGQNILLTDYHHFHNLGEAILHADGIEYKSQGKGPSKSSTSGSERGLGGPSRKDICRRFNNQTGCKFTDEECYYKHLCQACGKGGHGKSSCTAEKH